MKRLLFVSFFICLTICQNVVVGFSPNYILPLFWGRLSDTPSRGNGGHEQQQLTRIGCETATPIRLRLVLLQLFSKSNSNSNGNSDPIVDYFIRPSLSADVGRASQILADGFFKYRTNFLVYHWERLETYLSLESTFPKPNTFHQIFVACDSQTGLVLGMAEVDARLPKNNATNYGPYMCNVAIDEKYQRQGIASALIQRCEQQVEEWYRHTDGKIFCSLYLRVRASNVAAVGMYSKLHYMSILQEKDHKTGETVLVMRKQLDRSGNSHGDGRKNETPRRLDRPLKKHLLQ